MWTLFSWQPGEVPTPWSLGLVWRWGGFWEWRLTLHPHLEAALLKRGVGSLEPAGRGPHTRPVTRITWSFGKRQVVQARGGFLRCGPGRAAVKSGP